ncbi:MAG TPA: hypothetical protein VF391_12420 [Dermatophilaceae bacterium]
MAVRSVKVKSDPAVAAAPSAGTAKPAKASPAKPAKTNTAKPAKVSTAKPAKVSTTKAAKTSPAKAAKKQAKPAGRSGPTPIRVHYNVGMGNRITVRGDADPFRWDSGVDAQNSAADVWEFQLEQVPAGATFQFKPLINDTTYSAGDNYVGTGGQTLDIYPAF